jgi:hypothetical protein
MAKEAGIQPVIPQNINLQGMYIQLDPKNFKDF